MRVESYCEFMKVERMNWKRGDRFAEDERRIYHYGKSGEILALFNKRTNEVIY